MTELDNTHRYGLTQLDQYNLLTAIAEGCRQIVKDALAPLEKRIAELEAKGIQYCGVHQRASEYSRGSVVSYAGTHWIAVTDVPPNAIPGESGLWQLADKSQRESRPATAPRTQHRN